MEVKHQLKDILLDYDLQAHTLNWAIVTDRVK